MSQFLKTDLVGKVNNLKHFKTEALLPVFEAVANSIQAIEEKGLDPSSGRINIYIKRDDGFNEKTDEAPITGFEIEDNGIGFNNRNYESFLTADSTHKLEKGCKGIGRFFWLKAFDYVKIESIYQEKFENRKREILFNLSDGISELSNELSAETQKTIVKMIGFKEEYRKQPTAYKTSKKIAQRILEHCLSFFICEKAPLIIIHDSDSSVININDELYKDIKAHVKTDSLSLSTFDFSIHHLKLYSTTYKMNNLVFCANYRDVMSENISKLLGINTQFDEENKRFAYAVYVTGDYLDQHVDSNRMEFSIPEDSGVLKETYPVSLSELKIEVVNLAKEFLKEYLSILLDSKKGLVEKYIADKNPTLRATAHYCPEVYDEIEPNSSEEKIDEILYKYKGKAEYQIRKNSDKLLKTQGKSIEEIKVQYQEITEKLDAFQKDQLASYLLYRKMIIDLLDKKLELNKDGKYANEDIVHDIIFPRKANTDLIDYEDHNLWLIDENLTFHCFASSDKELGSFSSSNSDERPDIVVFSEVDGESRIARSCSIIELKKPQRKNFDQDPVSQLYDYLRKIRGEKVNLPNGRNLIADEKTRFYLYAVCDINNTVKTFAENQDFSELKGELGFYTYNSKLNAHVEILAFDKLVLDVQRRHKMFFEKLGIK